MKVPRPKTANPAFDLQNHAANLAARDARAGQREKTIARLRAKLEKKGNTDDTDKPVDATTSLSNKENVHVHTAANTDEKKKARKVKKRKVKKAASCDENKESDDGTLLLARLTCDEKLHPSSTEEDDS
jgi:hypothetical protein